MKKLTLIPLLFFIPMVLFAEAPVDNPFSLENPVVEAPLDNSKFMNEFFYMLFLLGVLITMVYLAAWFLKRMTNVRAEQLNATSTIQILEKRVLSTKTSLILLEIEGQQILVAETPTTVVQLHLDKEK
jgi:flagellar biogenesis protein FliO